MKRPPATMLREAARVLYVKADRLRRDAEGHRRSATRPQSRSPDVQYALATAADRRAARLIAVAAWIEAAAASPTQNGRRSPPASAASARPISDRRDLHDGE